MAQHRAAVYSIAVHTKRKTKDTKPLGSIDGKGTYLGDVLDGYLSQFNGESPDGTRRVHCATPVSDGEYIFLSCRHGKTGDAADIDSAQGETEFHQTPEHEHVLTTSSLFYLPREQRLGWWVLHINGGRSAKALLQSRMLSRFKEDFGEDVEEDGRGLTLKITPVVNAKALDAAVAQNQVEKLKLRRLRDPGEVEAIERWVPSREQPLVSLEVAAAGRGGRVLVDPIRRYLKGERDAMQEIVEFGGMTFEEASATIVLPNGKTRTINIQAREGGQAYTQNLEDIVVGDGGEPVASSLEKELRRSLEVTLGQT